MHGASPNTPLYSLKICDITQKRLVRRRCPRDMAMSHIEDHPLRYELSNELNTRSFPSMTAPGTVVFLALKKSLDIGRDADAERALLTNISDRFVSKHPQPDATHYSGT